MNTVYKKKLFILKKFFSDTRNRLSLAVSLCLTLILSSIIIFSLFLSEFSLEKLGQSQYFQSKVNQVLKKNEVYSEGDISIKFNKFGHAAIKIEKATFLNFNNLVIHDVNLKVDFIKYWFGVNSIDEVFFRKVVYSLPKNAGTYLDEITGSDLKFLTQY